MWQKIKPHFPLFSILTLAALLRLIAVFKYGDFWDDEMFNFVYSQKEWPQGLIYWLWETNPPLHLMILKIWLIFFPANEFFARLPSAIAGVSSVYLLYRFGRDIFDNKTAYLAALFLAIHSYHIFWSASTRVYSIMIFLGIWSAWIFYRIFFKEDTARLRRSFAVINFFLIFSHLSSLFFLCGQFIVLIIFKGKKSVTDWISINLLPFILGFTWIGASILIKAGNNLGHAWFLNMEHTVRSAVNPLINLLAGQLPFYFGLGCACIAVAIVAASLITDLKHEDPRLFILMTLILSPILLALACNVWHIKFFMVSLPLLALALAYALHKLIGAYLSSILIALLCAIGLVRLSYTLPLTDWNDVEKYFDKRNQTGKKTALVYNNYILKSQVDRYLPADISLVAFPLLLYENMSWDDMVVKKNYLFTELSHEKKAEWYKKNALHNYDRLIILHGEYSYMNEILSTMEEQGWKITEGPRKARLSGNYFLYTYEKD